MFEISSSRFNREINFELCIIHVYADSWLLVLDTRCMHPHMSIATFYGMNLCVWDSELPLWLSWLHQRGSSDQNDSHEPTTVQLPFILITVSSLIEPASTLRLSESEWITISPTFHGPCWLLSKGSAAQWEYTLLSASIVESWLFTTWLTCSSTRH